MPQQCFCGPSQHEMAHWIWTESKYKNYDLWTCSTWWQEEGFDSEQSTWQLTAGQEDHRYHGNSSCLKRDSLANGSIKGNASPPFAHTILPTTKNINGTLLYLSPEEGAWSWGLRTGVRCQAPQGHSKDTPPPSGCKGGGRRCRRRGRGQGSK